MMVIKKAVVVNPVMLIVHDEWCFKERKKEPAALTVQKSNDFKQANQSQCVKGGLAPYDLSYAAVGVLGHSLPSSSLVWSLNKKGILGFDPAFSTPGYNILHSDLKMNLHKKAFTLLPLWRRFFPLQGVPPTSRPRDPALFP